MSRMFHEQDTIERLEHKLSYSREREAELQDRISDVVDDNFSLRLRIKELEGAEKIQPFSKLTD